MEVDAAALFDYIDAVAAKGVNGMVLFGSTGEFAGWINAFSAGADNDFHGPLLNEQGRPISIDGLWSLFFGTFLNSDADTLYFTAGPNNQTNGLFGSLVAQVRTDTDELASK